MIIIIAILSYILGFGSCMIVVRILVKKAKNEKIIKEYQRVIEDYRKIKKESRNKENKDKENNKIIKLVKDEENKED